MKSDQQKKPVTVVVIPDKYQAYEISHFCVSPKYVEFLDRLMIPNGLIKDRIEKVASEIIEHFESIKAQHITMMCVLKGGFKFFADLIDAMERTIRARGTPIPISTDFVRVRSYVDILIVEDIIDTGKTMTALHKYLNTLQARSVTDVSLLLKRTPLSCGYRPYFAGFEIPDDFVVGYALDYNDYFRDLHHICVINNAGMEYFAVPDDKNRLADDPKSSD
ncbi:unnamed protein product [Mesocestoides corti]|uniref:Phosphoribosyltransferase domain-containing protein n=1 Tax=Mesocestoides corti TaxID=53468 RepID=A0A0R3U4K9_MESCO|nr:unnamed protein product [Mesocestoides corti]